MIILIYQKKLKDYIVEIKTTESEHNFKLFKTKKMFRTIDIELENTYINA